MIKKFKLIFECIDNYEYSEKVKEAARFAKEKHHGQRRRYTLEPYYEHCSGVAYIMSHYFEHDEDVLCASLLHDTIEDTETSLEEIEDNFGYFVSNFVDELTCKTPLSAGNRKKRKEIELARIAKCSMEAQSIKMADIIDNMYSIARYDTEFAKVYLPECLDLINYLDKSNEALRNSAKFNLYNAVQEVKRTSPHGWRADCLHMPAPFPEQ